jgi:hypothetical protein
MSLPRRFLLLFALFPVTQHDLYLGEPLNQMRLLLFELSLDSISLSTSSTFAG